MRPLNPRHPLQRLLVLTCGLLLPFASLRADDYADKILPILKDSCLNCHSTKKQKGDVDLEQFRNNIIIITNSQYRSPF